MQDVVLFRVRFKTGFTVIHFVHVYNSCNYFYEKVQKRRERVALYRELDNLENRTVLK